MVQNSSVEKIPPRTISGGFPWKILVFSSIIFGFSIFIYVGIKFGYGAYLSSREKNLDDRINELAAVVSQQDQQEFISFYSQIVNLREILKNRGISSPIFGLLEKHTIPSVYYTAAKFSSQDKKIEVNGIANSVNSFAQQMTIFDNSSEFAGRASLKQIGFDKGKVTFSIILSPRQEMFLTL